MAPRIPKKYRGHGLHIYCTARNCTKVITNPKSECGKSGLLAISCPFKESHTFQSRIWNPILQKTNLIRNHRVDSFEKALELHQEYQVEVKECNYNVITAKPESIKPIILSSCIQHYMDHLHDIDVPEYKKRNLSKGHISTCERQLLAFFESLEINNINPRSITTDAVNDEHLGYFHSELERRGYAGKTYNNYMGGVRDFFNYAIKELKIDMDNPIQGVKRKIENRNKSIIHYHEFNMLLDAISPDNSIAYVGEKSRKKVDYYRPWLKDVFIGALLTGERRKGLVELKWSDIEGDFIGIPDHKNNSRTKTNNYRTYVVITDDLMDLLIRLGIEKYLGSDNYIFVPEWENRKTLKEFMSKSFSHFWKTTGIQKEVSFRHLRKTYITQMMALLGDKAKNVKHTNDKTAAEYYIFEKEILKPLKGKRLFSN